MHGQKDIKKRKIRGKSSIIVAGNNEGERGKTNVHDRDNNHELKERKWDNILRQIDEKNEYEKEGKCDVTPLPPPFLPSPQ